MQTTRLIAAAFLVGGLVAMEGTARGETEIDFGHTAAGQIKAILDFPQPVELPASVFPGINGYATGEFGFHSLILDEPAEDAFVFSTSANFKMILVAKDPGMEVWNDTGTAFMTVGQSYTIGQPIFDNHPLFNLTSGTPGASYGLTMKLTDLNGIYTDSAPFTVNFTPAPEPSLVCALSAFSIGLLRRRVSR